MKKRKLLLAALALLIGAASAIASKAPDCNKEKPWPQLSQR
ncbi:MAG TPA: hypothetical protein VFZ94_13380 [Burkholderiales bacterium]